METNKAIEVLKKYSLWKKGEDISQPNPNEIVEAIDLLIKKLEFFKKEKYEITQSMSKRILNEHRKHAANIENWNKIAANKIYYTLEDMFFD